MFTGLSSAPHVFRRAAVVVVAAGLASVSGCAVVAPVPHASEPTPQASKVVALTSSARDRAEGLEPWVIYGDTAYGPDGEPRHHFDPPGGAATGDVVTDVALSADQKFAAVATGGRGSRDAGRDLFVVGLDSGVVTRVNVDSAGEAFPGALGANAALSISSDGRFVAYEWVTPRIVDGLSAPLYAAMVWDSATGESEQAMFPDSPLAGDSLNYSLQISDDGRFVLRSWGSSRFVAEYSQPLAGTSGAGRIRHSYFLDRDTGELVDMSTLAGGKDLVHSFSMAADGSLVAFAAYTGRQSPSQAMLWSSASNDLTNISVEVAEEYGTSFVNAVVIARDGSAVMYTADVRVGAAFESAGIVRYDVEEESSALIVDADGEGKRLFDAYVVALSGDGTVLMVEARIRTMTTIVFVFDALTGILGGEIERVG